MKKTVREICDMITNGELNYNQSTQRKFVYAGIKCLTDEGETTKAGKLIYSILEQGIQLPAVYFWYNTDTKQLNIHDGKQRILSLYYFINPQKGIDISTIRKGRYTTWDGLTEDDQQRLLDYEFDIVEKSGDSSEEEVSFYMINTNSLPLTDYECLSGMMYGTFLTEFENYIEARAKVLDNVKPIGRGEQAYKFLLAIFNIGDSKKVSSNSASTLRLNGAIRPVRNHSFIAEDYSFNKILNTFNDLMITVKGLKEDTALAMACYIVKNNYSVDPILYLYRESLRLINDIKTWDNQTHKTFINAFVQEGRKLDPQRNFTKDVKDVLYTRSPRCAHVDEEGNRCTESNYSKLEVDHIVAWKNGGRTTIDNAQLLCKHHNSSKGAK